MITRKVLNSSWFSRYDFFKNFLEGFLFKEFNKVTDGFKKMGKIYKIKNCDIFVPYKIY